MSRGGMDERPGQGAGGGARRRATATAALLLVQRRGRRRAPSCCRDTGSDGPWRLRLDSGSGEIDPETPPLAEGAAVSVAGRSLRLYSL